MATETALTKVNLFPSKSSYNTNKNSLGSGELSLINMQDFVESIVTGNVSTLSGNGYITLNGFIIQWGEIVRTGYDNHSEPKTKYINFNTPFTTACCAVFFDPTVEGSLFDSWIPSSDISTTRFKVYGDGTDDGGNSGSVWYRYGGHWLAIGY